MSPFSAPFSLVCYLSRPLNVAQNYGLNFSSPVTSSECSGLISARVSWLDLAVQRKSITSPAPIQKHQSPQHAFISSQPYVTGRTMKAAIQNSVSQVMPWLFNTFHNFSSRGKSRFHGTVVTLGPRKTVTLHSPPHPPYRK